MDMEDILEGSEPEIQDEVIEQEDTEQVEELQGEAEPETAEVEPEKQEAEPPAAEEDPNAFRKVTREEYQRLQESQRQAEAYQRAMFDERKKRQEAQAEAEKKKFWEAEDQDKFLEEAISQRVQSVEQRLTNQFQSDRLNLSEDLARQKYDDYQDKFQVFTQMVQRDPSIYQQMLSQPNPAEFAYRAAKRLQDIQEMGDPDSYRAKIEAEVREKIVQEVEEKNRQQYEQQVQQTNSLPHSFSEKQSKNVPRGSFAGPASLDSILG